MFRVLSPPTFFTQNALGLDFCGRFARGSKAKRGKKFHVAEFGLGLAWNGQIWLPLRKIGCFGRREEEVNELLFYKSLQVIDSSLFLSSKTRNCQGNALLVQQLNKRKEKKLSGNRQEWYEKETKGKEIKKVKEKKKEKGKVWNVKRKNRIRKQGKGKGKRE